jgi:hypothetical protein
MHAFINNHNTNESYESKINDRQILSMHLLPEKNIGSGSGFGKSLNFQQVRHRQESCWPCKGGSSSSTYQVSIFKLQV